MRAMAQPQDITVAQEEAGQTLAAVLRARLGLSWSAARSLCETGKVFLAEAAGDADDDPSTDPGRRLRPGQRLLVRMSAPAPAATRRRKAAQAIVFEDSQIVVVDKPAGIMSVPYERGDTGTAMDLIREAWRGQGKSATETPMHVVHRLDKESSGLLLFAKTRGAERELQALWRQHDIERRYLCVAHGVPREGRIESYLVTDRGDGLRGSPRLAPDDPRRGNIGKRAVSHVRVLEELRGAALCEVQIETGKTHQIRIHLAESGHPLVGEKVYIRDYTRRGAEPIASRRLLLHAQTQGFRHPTTGEDVQLRRDPPEDCEIELARLRGPARAARRD